MKKAIELLEDALDTMINETKLPEYYQEVAYIREAINILEEYQSPPRWETPEQWEKRTGDEYPDRAPVWCADNDDPADPWFLDYYENAVDDKRYYIICAVGGLVPPANWRPEENQ